MKNISFSKADLSDHRDLSKIAFTSKKHWGYPDDWLELWREDLIITEKYITENNVFKATKNNSTIGFAAISFDFENQSYEVEHMWILPEHMGNGYGVKLLNYAFENINLKEKAKIQVISDPNAIGFYNKIGFKKIGEVPSTPKGRSLPLLEKLHDK